MCRRLGNLIIFFLLTKHAFCTTFSYASTLEPLKNSAYAIYSKVMAFLDQKTFDKLNESFELKLPNPAVTTSSFDNNGIFASIFDFRIFPVFFGCALIGYLLYSYVFKHKKFSRAKEYFMRMVPVFYCLIFVQIIGSVCLLILGGPTLYFSFGNYCTGISFTHVVSLTMEIFLFFFMNFLRKRVSRTTKVKHDYKVQGKFVLESLSTGSQIAKNAVIVNSILGAIGLVIKSLSGNKGFDLVQQLGSVPVISCLKPLISSPPYNIPALISKSFLSFLTSEGAVGGLPVFSNIVGGIEWLFASPFFSALFYMFFIAIIGNFVFSVMNSYIIPYVSKHLGYLFNFNSNRSYTEYDDL